VNEEIDHAIKHGKLIIPIWLEKARSLRSDLVATNAIESKSFSTGAVQRIVSAVLATAPRIQRVVTGFDVRLMNIPPRSPN